jgi:hypothetical protein
MFYNIVTWKQCLGKILFSSRIEGTSVGTPTDASASSNFGDDFNVVAVDAVVDVTSVRDILFQF